jgi:hypothetical protein
MNRVPTHRFLGLSALLICAVLPAATAHARIKLITLPVRDRVEVRLDHESATLVEEQREVPLVEGENQIDFSWANTAIDPNTIVFRVVKAEFDVNVLSVSYPPGENSLVWKVSSAKSGSAIVRISYLLGNLGKTFSYRAVAGHDEKTLTLRQYVRVNNSANESFDTANVHVGIGDAFTRPIGLSETKELLIGKFPDVPIVKTYTVNPVEFDYIDRPKNKLRVPMHYAIHNDQQHQLGTEALPFGKARIFQEDGRGSSAFLGEDWGDYTAVGDRMKLAIGVARDINVIRTIDKVESKRIAGDLHNYEVTVKYEIENFKDQPVRLDVEEPLMHLRQEIGHHSDRPVQWDIGDQTTFPGGLDTKESRVDKAVLHADLPARDGDKAEKRTLFFHVILRNEW